MTATSTTETTATTQGLQTGHIGLNVTDLDRSTRFYRDVFEFTPLDESREEGRRFAFLSDDSRDAS